MGTIHSKILTALSNEPLFKDWMAGRCTRVQYNDWLERNQPALLGRGELNQDQLNLSSRFISLDELVERFIPALAPDARCGPEWLDGLKSGIRQKYNHSGLETYIFPEEEELTALLTISMSSRNILVIGSYYGYWSAFAAPAVAANAGNMTLVDADARVLEISKENYARLFNRGSFQFVAEDFFSWSSGADLSMYDTIMIDAEGRADSTNDEFRGKRIYGPILSKLREKISLTRVNLILHNMLTFNLTQNKYFAHKISTYMSDYRIMYHILNEVGVRLTELPTTEGLGFCRGR